MNRRVWVLGMRWWIWCRMLRDVISSVRRGTGQCGGGRLPTGRRQCLYRSGGADPFGRFLRHVLELEGVETETLMPDPEHATSTVVVDLDEQGSAPLPSWSNPVPICFSPMQSYLISRAGSGCICAPSRSPARPAGGGLCCHDGDPRRRWLLRLDPTCGPPSGASLSRCVPMWSGRYSWLMW